MRREACKLRCIKFHGVIIFCSWIIRDLKGDNILLDLSEETDNCPSLVITDFGCCLADKSHGLYLPYNTHDIDKGGNAALMAPEVITAEPGPFTSINYTKADLWTVGTIAYEIFGMKNPFHGDTKDTKPLKNHTYTENDLPSLPSDVPAVVSALIRNILSRSLYKVLVTHGRVSKNFWILYDTCDFRGWIRRPQQL